MDAPETKPTAYEPIKSEHREAALELVKMCRGDKNAPMVLTDMSHFVADLEARVRREERESCASIVETAAMLASPDGVIPKDDPEHERLARISTILANAADAILARGLEAAARQAETYAVD